MRTDLFVAAVLMLLAVAFGLALLLFPEAVTRYLPPRAVPSTRLVLRLIGVLTLLFAALSLMRALRFV